MPHPRNDPAPVLKTVPAPSPPSSRYSIQSRMNMGSGPRITPHPVASRYSSLLALVYRPGTALCRNCSALRLDCRGTGSVAPRDRAVAYDVIVAPSAALFHTAHAGVDEIADTPAPRGQPRGRRGRRVDGVDTLWTPRGHCCGRHCGHRLHRSLSHGRGGGF